MATPSGIAVATRQAASGYALRALPRRRTYTTSWDINERLDKTTFSLYDSCRALRQLALTVYPEAIHASTTTHFNIGECERARFRYLAELTFARSALYSRFLEVEEIGRLDACATSLGL